MVDTKMGVPVGQEEFAEQLPVGVGGATTGERIAWYAVRTRRNHEWIVLRSLEARSLESYLPSHRVRRRWAQRVKTLDVPLFSGYVFVRMDLCRCADVQSTTGVVELVGGAAGPSPIHDSEIDAIKNVVQSGVEFDCHPELAVGSPVRVIRGQLKGLIGLLQSKNEQHCFVIQVPLLGQSLSVPMDPLDLEVADAMSETSR